MLGRASSSKSVQICPWEMALFPHWLTGLPEWYEKRAAQGDRSPNTGAAARHTPLAGDQKGLSAGHRASLLSCCRTAILAAGSSQGNIARFRWDSCACTARSMGSAALVIQLRFTATPVNPMLPARPGGSKTPVRAVWRPPAAAFAARTWPLCLHRRCARRLPSEARRPICMSLLT